MTTQKLKTQTHPKYFVELKVSCYAKETQDAIKKDVVAIMRKYKCLGGNCVTFTEPEEWAVEDNYLPCLKHELDCLQEVK